MEDISEKVVETATKKIGRFSPVIVSLICVGLILFILFTQCEVSSIRLKAKDASLVLIFLALLAYVNGYEVWFLVLLGVFVVIYFMPEGVINKAISPMVKKKGKKVKPRVKEEVYEETQEYTTDNEITLDTDIDDEVENVYESVEKERE